MKKSTFKFLAISLFFLFGNAAIAQDVVTITPEYATAFDEITLTLNTKLSCPDSSLFAVDSVMMHSGVNLDGSAWSNVVEFDGVGADGQRPILTSNGDSTWSITFTPVAFYGIEEGSVVTEINCVFNGGSWDNEGKAHGEDGACVDFAIPLSLVGIGEGHTAVTFSMYPNPVENKLTIGNLQDVQVIEIFSITGKRVIMLDNITTSKVIVNTSELGSGIYFVTTHGNDVQTSKFMKN
jgi:hypothetical protein